MRGRTQWGGDPDGIPNRTTDGLQSNASTSSNPPTIESGQAELKLLQDIAKSDIPPEVSFDESRSAVIATMCNYPTPTTANSIVSQYAQQHAVDTDPESTLEVQARNRALAARSTSSVSELLQAVEDTASTARERIAEAKRRLTNEISDRGGLQMLTGSSTTNDEGTLGEGGLPQQSALMSDDAPSLPLKGSSAQRPVDFEVIWNRQENRTLSPEQKQVIKILVQYLANKFAYDVDPIPAKACPAPPALLVHGRGGLGKTKIIKTLVHELGPANFELMAPTGSSAKVLGGATFHSELMIRSEGKGKLNALSSDDIAKLKMSFDGCQVVVLDEVSMVGSDMFHAIMSRLKDVGSDPTHPFGGFAVVVLGDFFQMGPVKDTSLLKPLIDSYLSPPSTTPTESAGSTKRAKKTVKSMDRKDQEVALALRTFIRIELRPHEHQRSRDDPDMEFLQTALRNTSIDFPVTDEVLNLLRTRTLSIETAQQARDTPGQFSWRDGIMVLRNQTRRLLNRVFVTAFGNENGLPLFQFQNKISGRFSSDVHDALHATYPSRLTTRLTIGTPVFITKNQAPADLGITNGTIGKVEGFVYNSSQDQLAFDAAVQRFFSDRSCIDTNDINASIISIPFPDRILVRVAGEDLTGLAVLASSKEDHEPGEDVIFPIQARSVRITLNKFEFAIQEHDLEPAFALTNYKIQSQTRPNMTLDLIRVPRSKMCLRALYVGLTRTTSFRGIHILPDNSGAPVNLNYMKNFTFDPYLRVFEQAYDDDGRISGERVRSLIRSGLLEKPQRKKKGAGHGSKPQTSFAEALAIQEQLRLMQEQGEQLLESEELPHRSGPNSPTVVDSTSHLKTSRRSGKRPMSKRKAQTQDRSSSSSSDAPRDSKPTRTRSKRKASQQDRSSSSSSHAPRDPRPIRTQKKAKASPRNAPSPPPTSFPQRLVGAHRWAGVSARGETVHFKLNGVQHRWDYSCPIDATQFALANAASRSNVFRALLERLHPKVAAYLRALWSPWERTSNVQLRQLRLSAALEMITRQIDNDASRQRRTGGRAPVHFRGEGRNRIVSTYGNIYDWLNCALPDRPFTSGKLHTDFTCTSVLLDTIRDRARLDSNDLRHNAHGVQNIPYLLPEYGGFLRHANELAASWRNQFEGIRCEKTLETPINEDDSTVRVTATEVITNMLTSNEHEAINVGSDQISTHPKGVVLIEDHNTGNRYKCGAPCFNDTKLVNFPALCVLCTHGAPPGQSWVEQALEISLEAPMQDGAHSSKNYALAAIVQHLPHHWTVSYYDYRNDTWFYHDGMQHSGNAQPCSDQTSSIQTNADTFYLVYVKL